MAEVRETELPGVGIRNDFVTGEGRRVGVLVHRTGRRELLLYDEQDPDACRVLASFDEDDARTLAELLGASRLSENLVAMQQHIRGLALDWLPVDEASTVAGLTLRDSAIHSRTGVSVVAILRGDASLAAPGPEDTLEVGDTVVAIGTTSGMKQFLKLLSP